MQISSRYRLGGVLGTYKHIVIEDVFSHVFSLLYCRRYIIDRKNIFIKNKILSSNPVDIVAKTLEDDFVVRVVPVTLTLKTISVNNEF